MYLRDTIFETLGDVVGKLHDTRRTWGGSSVDVRVNLDVNPTDEPEAQEEADGEDAESYRRLGTITLGKHEIRATEGGLNSLAQFFDVPTAFFNRVPGDEQQFILDHRIQRSADTPVTVKWTEKTGLEAIYPTNQTRVDLGYLGEQLLDVFPEDANVLEWWNTADDFRLDIIVPEGYDKGIGGDSKVGDITHGGIRVGQNRKQNLAPWVQTIMFRLACTNGMEVPDWGLKVDARGQDAETVVHLLMNEAIRAFDRVEEDIKHFYDLRTVPVTEDHTGMFRRLARETGIPERTIGRMENTLPDALLAEEEVSMFHLVNHMTNQANNPSLLGHRNARRALEQAGGQLVSDHAARCNLCHSRLS